MTLPSPRTPARFHRGLSLTADSLSSAHCHLQPASAMSFSPQSPSVGAAKAEQTTMPKLSLLPPISSLLSLANALELAKLLVQPVLFFAFLPLLLAWGAVKYFLLGGRAEGAKLAASLPQIIAKRLEQMSADAGLPTVGQQGPVTTSTRLAPKEKGPRPFQSSFVANGSVNLHVITGGDFSSSKPLIFFIHGFPECWTTWQSQMIYFARLGYPVAAMDMRGFGLSTAPAEVGAYSMRTLVGDVTTVLSKLRSTGDSAPSSSHGSAERGRSVVLCGHDWGGVVAWNLAFLEHNEEVKSISKMVIANAPHPGGFMSYALYHDRFQLIRSWYMAWFQVPLLPEFFMYTNPRSWAANLTSSDKECAAATAADPSTCRGMINYYRAALHDTLSGSTMKPIGVRVPVLQLWGKNDTALGVGLATTLPRARWTPHPRSRVALLDASHWVLGEKPKEVNEAILKFINEE